MTHVRWVWAFLDVPETEARAAEKFWGAVTRTRLSDHRGERGEFATFLPEYCDPWFKVQHVLDGGGVHLDLDVDDVSAAADEATRLGATELGRFPDGNVVVMRSPGGFTFCLTSWTNAGAPSHQVREGQPDLLDQVCLDTPSGRYDDEVDFWAGLTGWQRRPATLPEFTSLTRPDGIPVRLLFQRLGEADGVVTGHLDFACHDRHRSREVHESAGASVESEHEFWIVMRDPAGRRYCLTHREP